MLDPRPAVRLGPSEDQRQHGSTRGTAPVRAGSPSLWRLFSRDFLPLSPPPPASACASARGQRARQDERDMLAQMRASVYLHARANEEEEKAVVLWLLSAHVTHVSRPVRRLRSTDFWRAAAVASGPDRTGPPQQLVREADAGRRSNATSASLE